MWKSVTNFALAGLLLIGAPATAVLAQSSAPASQDAAPAPMPGPRAHRMQPPDPEKQLAHLTARLNLTADQQAQIKPILTDRAQQMQTLRSDTTLAPQDKMAKMKSLHAESDAKIEAVLNDQQKQQYAEMKQKRQKMMHEHMKHQMGGMGTEAPPPPPPAQ